METEPGVVRFRLPVTWDVGAQVLKHTARNGRTPLTIQRYGNGFLRLQLPRAFRPAITIDVMFIAERNATTVLLVNVTRRFRLSMREHQRVDALLEQFRADAEFFAEHLGCVVDEAARQDQQPRSAHWSTRVPRLHGAALDV